MEKVNVKKEELLSKLELNHQNHKEQVVAAKEAYREEIKRLLKAILLEVEEGMPIDFNALYKVDKPVDKREEYSDAIGMLKMHTEDEITLTMREYRCYVLDKWDWSREALLSNTKYLK